MTKEVILPKSSLVSQWVYWVTYKTMLTQKTAVLPQMHFGMCESGILGVPTTTCTEAAPWSLFRRNCLLLVCPWGGALLTLPTLSEFLLPTEFFWFPEPSKPPSGQKGMFHFRRDRYITNNWVPQGGKASCAGFAVCVKAGLPAAQVRVDSLAPCHQDIFFLSFGC